METSRPHFERIGVNLTDCCCVGGDGPDSSTSSLRGFTESWDRRWERPELGRWRRFGFSPHCGLQCCQTRWWRTGDRAPGCGRGPGASPSSGRTSSSAASAAAARRRSPAPPAWRSDPESGKLRTQTNRPGFKETVQSVEINPKTVLPDLSAISTFFQPCKVKEIGHFTKDFRY